MSEMTFGDVASLVAAGEGQRFEFKRSTGQLQRGVETLCAFLNGRGGTVVFGVDPEGVVRGQEVSDKSMRDTYAQLRKLEPHPFVDIQRVAVPESGGLELLCLIVRAQPDRGPFDFDGRPYERVASSTQRMSQEGYEALLLERRVFDRRWEKQIIEGAGPEVLDDEAVLALRRLAIEAGRIPESASRESVPVFLDSLGLTDSGKVTNAAVALFGRDPQSLLPQCSLRMARFRGDDKREFVDERQVTGPASTLIDEAMLFFDRHLPVAAAVPHGQILRSDRPVIPVDVRREVIVNAICHRDYREPGGSVSLAIFDSRVEVWSYGLLPRGISVEDLSRGHLSVPRNPVIADVLYKAKFIEKWGRGTRMVVDECLAAGLARPTFVEQAGSVRVVIPTGLRSRAGDEDVIENGRERAVLDLLRGGGEFSSSEVAEALDEPLRSVQRYLRVLKAAGVIDQIGDGRASRYRIAPRS